MDRFQAWAVGEVLFTVDPRWPPEAEDSVPIVTFRASASDTCAFPAHTHSLSPHWGLPAVEGLSPQAPRLSLGGFHQEGSWQPCLGFSSLSIWASSPPRTDQLPGLTPHPRPGLSTHSLPLCIVKALLPTSLTTLESIQKAPPSQHPGQSISESEWPHILHLFHSCQ